MFGLGDNLHIRAIAKQLIEQKRDVWLETSWLALYHDLIAQGLHVIRKHTYLRTQTKNAEREREKFTKGAAPGIHTRLPISYRGIGVKAHGSVLAAMIQNAKGYGLDYATADFRMPIPPQWYARVDALIAQWQPTKPIMVYRPLTVRKELSPHFNQRHPDYSAYARVYQELRERYFVVSVADLVPGIEWTTGKEVPSDVQMHKGELEFESLAALWSRAALVYAYPGFAIPLAQAVSTPAVCMFGGYENSSSFSAGGRYSRYLGLDVINPCCCMTAHNCDKRIDVDASLEKVRRFLADTDRGNQRTQMAAAS